MNENGGPPAANVVSGAVVSTVNDRVAGVGSVLPAESVARTENVYVPSASVPRLRGDEHAWNDPVAAPGPSRRHSNVEPDSVEENVNDGALFADVPAGPVLIVVSGAVVSTVNVRVAGVGSTLPAASIARTENVCVPSASVPEECGDVQRANDPSPPGPSSLHSNVEPDSDDVNENGGPPAANVVSGGVVSTVNVRVAGVGSTLPAASIARTENVCVAVGQRARGVRRRARLANDARPSSLHSNVEPASDDENENGGTAGRQTSSPAASCRP